VNNDFVNVSYYYIISHNELRVVHQSRYDVITKCVSVLNVFRSTCAFRASTPIHIASVHYLLRSPDAFVQTSESDNRCRRMNNHKQSISYRNDSVAHVFGLHCRVPHTPICIIRYNTVSTYFCWTIFYTTGSSEYLLFIIVAVIVIRESLSVAYPLRSERTRDKRFSRVRFYNAIIRAMTYTYKYIVSVAVI